MALDFLAASSESAILFCAFATPLLVVACLSNCADRFLRKLSMNASLTLTVSISKLNTDRNISVESRYSSWLSQLSKNSENNFTPL